MRARSLLLKLNRLERTQLRPGSRRALLEDLRAAPDRLMSLCGIAPDPWQAEMLRSDFNTLLLCSRQVGKSTTAAALALCVALLESNSLTLILSPTKRQSSELFRTVLALYRALGRPVPAQRENQHELQLTSTGDASCRCPGRKRPVRGYPAVTLLIRLCERAHGRVGTTGCPSRTADDVAEPAPMWYASASGPNRDCATRAERFLSWVSSARFRGNERTVRRAGTARERKKHG